MDILQEVRELQDHLFALRRDIHQHPELSWKETRTQALICTELDALGIPYEKVCGTGVIGVLRGELDGPVIALRADMDALPVQEQNTHAYRSVHAGVMHACGHDCHVAMLLTAARVLSRHRDVLHGTVKLVFQPAEEVIQGAREMCALPQLADVTRIFGAHVWVDLPVGSFSVEEGPRMASADNLYLTVRGRSAHGAQPHQSTDAIVAACAVVGALQSVVSRTVSPLQPAVVTIGTIEGGRMSNIIADEVKLSGTVRSFDPAVRDAMEQQIAQTASSTAQAYGAVCEMEYQRCTPAVINEPDATAHARSAVSALFGDAAMVHLEKTTGGEDFAWFMERIPGCYLFIGAEPVDGSACYPHHHACFEIDEQALVSGAAILTELALCSGC